MRPERASDGAIRDQVERILASAAFCGSRKLSHLFQFLVDQVLAGRSFNEYSIAIDVFQRDESFDPRIDPVVRVHMLRLRAKLNEYQATAGLQDPIEIVLPPRTYVPTIRTRSRQPLTKVPDPARTQRNIAIRSFRCLSMETADQFFCDGLVEELIYALTKLKNLRVIPVQALAGAGGSEPERSGIARAIPGRRCPRRQCTQTSRYAAGSGLISRMQPTGPSSDRRCANVKLATPWGIKRSLQARLCTLYSREATCC
jgi:hypothetical protein